jgi:sugar (pentulose or hexulose) kinase
MKLKTVMSSRLCCGTNPLDFRKNNMSKYILAVDVGTQSTRAAIVKVDGEILHISQIKHEVDSPHPGWAQQSPDQWWLESCQAINDVIGKTKIDPKTIAAIASCGQMHGPVGVDEEGNVTTPNVQLWCDKRCQAQCKELRISSNETKLSNISANPINPAWIGLKIKWYKDNEPGNYDKAISFLTPKDFINFRLTGVMATDYSEASGSFIWDWEKDIYSNEIAEAVGVDINKFPKVYASNNVIGNVTKKMTELTTIPEGIPVVAGGGDFPVSMLGFGLVGEGITADVTGTSNLLATHSEKPLIHPAIQNLRHVVDGWVPFRITDCGGLSMKWCKEFMSSTASEELSYDKLIDMAAKTPIGSDGLLFYPYMLGERRHENMSARGAFFGLNINHDASHFAKATMEGVALALGQNAKLFGELGHKIDKVLCVGGGSKNKLWNQIKADILGVPFEISDEPEAGIKGAAMLGAAGVGLIDNLVEESIKRRRPGQAINPIRENSNKYRKVLKEFERMYDHMLGYWQSEG